MMRPAVLIDCSTRGGLAVARSLARKMVPISAIATRSNNVAFRSRYVRNKLIVSDFIGNTRQTLDRILRHLETLDSPIVLPMTDAAATFVNQNRAALEGLATLAINSSYAVSSTLDKSENLDLCRKLGVPFPKTIAWEPDLRPDALIDELRLPLVVKNPFPESADPNDAWAYRFKIVQDKQQLARCIDDLKNKQPRPIFQEFVSGYATNVCCFAVQGKVHAIHQYVSRRRSRHAGILREIVAVRAELEAHARDILKALHWTGPAHLGFIDSLNGDQTWYMETNGRFWASVQGTIHAGWDMPRWLYQYYADESIPSPGPIEVGSLTCYRPGDLQALMGYLAGGRSPTFYTEPGKGRATLDYMRSFKPSVHSDVCDWRDPLPGITDFGRVFGDLFRRGLGRLARNKPDPTSR